MYIFIYLQAIYIRGDLLSSTFNSKLRLWKVFTLKFMTDSGRVPISDDQSKSRGLAHSI